MESEGCYNTPTFVYRGEGRFAKLAPNYSTNYAIERSGFVKQNIVIDIVTLYTSNINKVFV